MEAGLAGYEVIGSDIDEVAVRGTRHNLAGVKVEGGKIFKSEVTAVRTEQVGGKVEVIVTEPFLGRQTPKRQDLGNIFRGLEKLYWGAFRHWREILQDEARVVIVFPRVKEGEGRVKSLDGMLDKLEGIGYTKCSLGLVYARPQAMVEREICVFDYKKIR
jgi:tRNA G10  N-methylase Trm11